MRGILASRENLRKIGRGVSKDDLYSLIGRPHFREMRGAREWDYVLKFRDAPGAPVRVCQYKVIFDKDMTGQGFHWKPGNCAEQWALGMATAPAAGH